MYMDRYTDDDHMDGHEMFAESTKRTFFGTSPRGRASRRDGHPAVFSTGGMGGPCPEGPDISRRSGEQHL